MRTLSLPAVLPCYLAVHLKATCFVGFFSVVEKDVFRKLLMTAFAQALRVGTRVLRNTTVVALLQPPPEVFALFDRVMLMREGSIVYNGTHACLAAVR